MEIVEQWLQTDSGRKISTRAVDGSFEVTCWSWCALEALPGLWTPVGVGKGLSLVQALEDAGLCLLRSGGN